MKKTLLTTLGIACLSAAVAQQTPSPSWSITQNASFTMTSAGIKFLDALDANTVWMIGYDGTAPNKNYAWWSRTINGGTSYTSGSIWPDTNTYKISNMEGINGCTAWVAAFMKAGDDRGKLFKTTNGGTNWVDVTAPNMYTVTGSSFLNLVAFLDDKKTGFCMGDPIAGEFEIYRTTDAGTTWTMVPGANIPNPVAGEYGLVNCYEKRGNNMLWFGTNKNRVYRSTDAGITWSVSPALTSTLGAALDITDIAFADANNGICNAYFGPTGNGTLSVFTSTDAGANWVELPTIDANYGRNDVCAVPGTTYLASVGAGSGNNIISFSQDGGTNWNNWGGANIQYLCVDFISPKLGWAGSFASNTLMTQGGVYKYSGGLLNTAPFAAFSPSTVSCPNYCPGTFTMVNYSTGNPAPSYSWTSSGGTITSPTATNAEIAFPAVGNYTVTLATTSGTATSTYTMVIPIAVCVGVQDIAADNSNFMLYPNPAGETLNIELANSENFTYTMTDMLGKQVLKGSVQNNNKASVNVSDLTKGVYFLTVNSNGEKSVKKIIVE